MHKNAPGFIKNALKLYKGTVIIVSHDRDFLIGLTNKVVEFREGYIRTHLGDINDYLSYRKKSSMREVEKRSKSRKKELNPTLGKADKKRLEQKIKKMRFRSFFYLTHRFCLSIA